MTTQTKSLTPKFAVGDLVQVSEQFNSNPCEKAVHIGTITSITLKFGRHFFSDHPLSRVLYRISGLGISVREKDISPYTAGTTVTRKEGTQQ